MDEVVKGTVTVTRVIKVKDIQGDEACKNCDGCGYVANDEDETPWKFWAELPPEADLSVRMGLVRPFECSKCGGTGRVDDNPG